MNSNESHNIDLSPITYSDVKQVFITLLKPLYSRMPKLIRFARTATSYSRLDKVSERPYIREVFIKLLKAIYSRWPKLISLTLSPASYSKLYKMSESPYLKKSNVQWVDSKAGKSFSMNYHVSSKNKTQKSSVVKNTKMSECPSITTLNAKLKQNRTSKGFSMPWGKSRNTD